MFEICKDINENYKNVFVMYTKSNSPHINSLTLSHLIIDSTEISYNHLYYMSNNPNICLIEYLNDFCDFPSSLDFDVIQCNRYIKSENIYMPIRKKLHYDAGLYRLYQDYIVANGNSINEYYNSIKYYHHEYLDFKPVFDKILKIYNDLKSEDRYDILKKLNMDDNFYCLQYKYSNV